MNKWMIWGYHYFRKHPYDFLVTKRKHMEKWLIRNPDHECSSSPISTAQLIIVNLRIHPSTCLEKLQVTSSHKNQLGPSDPRGVNDSVFFAGAHLGSPVPTSHLRSFLGFGHFDSRCQSHMAPLSRKALCLHSQRLFDRCVAHKPRGVSLATPPVRSGALDHMTDQLYGYGLRESPPPQNNLINPHKVHSCTFGT